MKSGGSTHCRRLTQIIRRIDDMTNLAYLNLNVSDFLRDRATLHTIEARESYTQVLLQLCISPTGRLKIDRNFVKNLLGFSSRKWLEIWRSLEPLFSQTEDGLIYHKDIDYAMHRAESIREKRSEAGKKGMASRWGTDRKRDNRSYNKRYNKPITIAPENPKPKISTSPFLSTTEHNSPPAREADAVPAAGGYARQRAGGALASPPAGEVKSGADADVGGIKPIGQHLPEQVRETIAANSEPEPSAGFIPPPDDDPPGGGKVIPTIPVIHSYDHGQAQRESAAIDFACSSLPPAQARLANLGLMGCDPEKSGLAWLEDIEQLMAMRQGYAEAAE
jgi:uncharacterized protein YdaU (DUF1376 family)